MLEDQDLDGVADAADTCPDTPEGDVTTADGCTACPCDGPTAGSVWESRGSFLACITDAVRGRKQARAMSRRGARAAIKAARKSSCGDANLTRCDLSTNQCVAGDHCNVDSDCQLDDPLSYCYRFGLQCRSSLLTPHFFLCCFSVLCRRYACMNSSKSPSSTFMI